MSNPKHEAIRLMHFMFGIQNGASNGMVEQFVDLIIKAAVAEIGATAEESSVDHLRDATKMMSKEVQE